MRIFLFLLLFLYLYPVPGFSQVYLCQGVYRDVPCNSERLGSSEESKDRLGQQKDEVLTALDGVINSARRKSGYSAFDRAAIRSYCEREDVGVDECQARAAKAQKEIIAAVNSQIKLEQRRQELMHKARELDFRRMKFLEENRRRRLR
jgi:hypothetical protein